MVRRPCSASVFAGCETPIGNGSSSRGWEGAVSCTLVMQKSSPGLWSSFFLSVAHSATPKVMLRIPGRVHENLVTMESSRDAKQILHGVFL